MNRVGVIGNGLSIAAAEGFSLPNLTAAVEARLGAIDLTGTSALTRLNQIRERLEADGHQAAGGTTFERLLGPLDRLSALIDIELAAVVGALRQELVQPLQAVGVEVRTLYVRGVGAVLGEIDALDAVANLDPVRDVARWITRGIAAGDRVTIYTPNYDPLLDRALLELRTETINGVVYTRFSLADEFSGLQNDGTLTLAAGTRAATVIPRRDEPWARDRPVDLVHLHGGQHWIRTKSGMLYKTPVGGLRDADIYGRWLRGEAVAVSPAVLLTDQKGAAVLKSPFVDGYQRLRHDLRIADRVVVAGYGFGDIPLNDLLREGLAGPRPAGSRWLINRNSAATDDDAAESFADTAEALGVAPDALPDVILSALPNIVGERPTFFEP